MTDCIQLARPVMGRPADFYPDKATWQLLEELEQLSAPNCSIEDDRTLRGNTVSLEGVLTKIQSNLTSMVGFLSCQKTTSTVCRKARRFAADAIHPNCRVDISPDGN